MNFSGINWLFASQYIPHGHCYLWQTSLVWLHVLADALIAISYYLIPSSLLYFVRQREDVPYKRVLILFSAFILSCGTVHVLEIVTLWYPFYWLSGTGKGITALISLYTALSLIPLIPKALNAPSSKHLTELNQQLTAHIKEKELAEKELQLLNTELEQRVLQRTDDLTRANIDLKQHTEFNEKITDLAPNILYVFDVVSKKNVYCNPFIEEVLGYSTTTIQAYKSNLMAELIHPEDIDLVEQHFYDCLQLKGDNYLEIEYRIRDIRGNWHWFHDRSTVFARNEKEQAQRVLGIAYDITLRKESQLAAEQLNEKLKQQIENLEIRNRERIKLAAMNNLLQACMNVEEAQKALPDLIKPLFPDTNGAVYLVNNSKNSLDAIATWGIVASEYSFDLEDCWSLRRSSTHVGEPTKPGLYCHHVHQHGELKPTLCLPMMAHGETLGILYLCWNSEQKISRNTKKLGETVAQNIALAAANLKLQETLRYQSLRDPLTGLFNRRYLEDSLVREIDRAARKQHFIGIIIMDIDHFKRFNDTYGHDAGDLVLKEVGSYLLSQTRQYDLACRYGGEELVVVMPDASLENAFLRAEAIRNGIKKLQLKYEGKQLPQITVSMGVSCFPDDGTRPQDLITVADKALYKAKEGGRDRVVRG